MLITAYRPFHGNGRDGRVLSILPAPTQASTVLDSTNIKLAEKSLASQVANLKVRNRQAARFHYNAVNATNEVHQRSS